MGTLRHEVKRLAQVERECRAIIKRLEAEAVAKKENATEWQRQAIYHNRKHGETLEALRKAEAERDAIAAAAFEASAEACDDYPRVAPDDTEWPHYDDQIAHSQSIIRSLTPGDARAALTRMLDTARKGGIQDAAMEMDRRAVENANTPDSQAAYRNAARNIRALITQETSHD